MEDFEKRIKNRLRDASSEGRVDADDLWAAIEPNIGEDAPSKKGIPVWRWLLLAFLLTGFAILMLLRNGNENPKGTAIYTDTIKSGELKEPALGKEDLNAEISPTKEKAEDKSLLAPFRFEIDDENQKSKKSQDSQGKQEDIINQGLKNTTIANPVPEHDLKEYTSSTQNELIGQSGLAKDETDLTGFTLSEREGFEVTQKVPVLELLLPLKMENAKETIALPGIVKVKGKAKRLSLGIFSGGHVLSNKFENGTEDALGEVLEDSFSPELGFSLSAELSYRIKRRISFKTGIEYFQSQEEFDYTRKWDTLIWRDGVPGTELINAEAERRVRHYNKHTFISIPLMLSLGVQKNRLQYGLDFGLSLNFVNSQSGRILNERAFLTDYSDEQNTPSLKPDFFMAYQLQPYLGYAINNQFSIRVRGDFRLQNYGFAELIDLKHTSVLTGLGIGLIYIP